MVCVLWEDGDYIWGRKEGVKGVVFHLFIYLSSITSRWNLVPCCLFFIIIIFLSSSMRGFFLPFIHPPRVSVIHSRCCSDCLSQSRQGRGAGSRAVPWGGGKGAERSFFQSFSLGLSQGLNPFESPASHPTQNPAPKVPAPVLRICSGGEERKFKTWLCLDVGMAKSCVVVGRRAMAKASRCMASKVEEVLLRRGGKRRRCCETSLAASSLRELGLWMCVRRGASVRQALGKGTGTYLRWCVTWGADNTHLLLHRLKGRRCSLVSRRLCAMLVFFLRWRSISWNDRLVVGFLSLALCSGRMFISASFQLQFAELEVCLYFSRVAMFQNPRSLRNPHQPQQPTLQHNSVSLDNITTHIICYLGMYSLRNVDSANLPRLQWMLCVLEYKVLNDIDDANNRSRRFRGCYNVAGFPFYQACLWLILYIVSAFLNSRSNGILSRGEKVLTWRLNFSTQLCKSSFTETPPQLGTRQL